MYKGNFIGDKEKMHDFTRLTKEEFMNTYSYLTDEEYDNTECIYQEMLDVLEEVETKLFILSEKIGPGTPIDTAWDFTYRYLEEIKKKDTEKMKSEN